MSNVATLQQEEKTKCKVYSFRRKTKVKASDGSIKQTPNNSIKGDPHEVYPIKDKAEVKAIQQYFLDKKNAEVYDSYKEIQARNYLMWTFGINIGLRASDLLRLKWKDVFNDDHTIKDGYRLTEKKTGKYKNIYFNKYIEEAVLQHVKEFNINIDDNEYIFKSQRGSHLDVNACRLILKEAAQACGIKKNVGSHTMRKTFGYHYYQQHKYDVDVLIHLQTLFNHDSPRTTLAYIGISDEENKQYYNDMSWDD